MIDENHHQQQKQCIENDLVEGLVRFFSSPLPRYVQKLML
jgi:hypothetical protein